MTRATLLHVLDRPTALGPAEVRELEQLAQAFPYCQTAHLLLAKAAHDQGTMLAGQRLRRAATYAADRTLLRRLIEQVEPAAVAEEIAVEEVEELAPALIIAPTAPVQIAELQVAPVAVTVTAVPVPEVPAAAELAPVPQAAPTTPVIAAVPEIMPVAEPVPVSSVDEPTFVAPSVAPEPEALLVLEEVPVAVAPESVVAQEEPATETEPVQEVPAEATVAPLPEPAPPVEPAVSDAVAEAPVLIDQEGVVIATAETALPEPQGEPAPLLEEATEPAQEEEDLPAQAPAIRPPVEVGEARFEFGLAEPPPPAVATYELPGLVDEWAASAVTRTLGGPELFAEELATDATPVVFTPAAFTGDPTIGYGFGESSRLGFSMQLLNLLEAQAESADLSTAPIAAAQPPAAPLPPVGTFFEPDPLLLDHWATHCPPPPALPSSLDLINNFLRRQPRLTRPAMLPPSPSTQADLSVRSTRAEPDLVSENLARIYVRQGKVTRAIEIYEKLMVKQPEKMAYFAAQIQLLQPSA